MYLSTYTCEYACGLLIIARLANDKRNRLEWQFFFSFFSFFFPFSFPLHRWGRANQACTLFPITLCLLLACTTLSSCIVGKNDFFAPTSLVSLFTEEDLAFFIYLWWRSSSILSLKENFCIFSSFLIFSTPTLYLLEGKIVSPYWNYSN